MSYQQTAIVVYGGGNAGKR